MPLGLEPKVLHELYWVMFDGREISSRVHYTSSLHKLGYAPCLSGSSSRLRESLGPPRVITTQQPLIPKAFVSTWTYLEYLTVVTTFPSYSVFLKRHSSQGWWFIHFSSPFVVEPYLFWYN